MPRLLPRHYAKILYEVTKEVDKKSLDSAVAEFLKFLQREHMLKKFDSIIQEFSAYAKEQEGVRTIEITTARPLTSDLVKQVMNQFGQDVEAEEKIDKAIIGGLIVETNNTILDGSVRTELRRLKQELI